MENLDKYDTLNCPICDTLCKPVRENKDGSVSYQVHKCQLYEFTPIRRGFKIIAKRELIVDGKLL